MSPLAGKPLRYLIALDSDPGEAGTVTELGYDASAPPAGVCIKYGNLRDQASPIEMRKQNSGNYGPYLPIDEDDDIFADYDEPSPNPDGAGFERLIDEQIDGAVSDGWPIMEWDNLDTYDSAVALRVFEDTSRRGLLVAAKNPNLVEGDQPALIRHHATCAAIYEHAKGLSASDMHALRVAGGKPDQPIRVVTHGSQRAWAQQIAGQAIALGLVDFGVTYSPDVEYGSVEHILRPTAPAISIPTSQPMPAKVTGAEIIAKARSFIGKFTDGSDVPMMARAIGQAYPDMKGYAAIANNDTAWCAIFCAYVLTLLGVRPPFVADSSDTNDFMWADAPLEAKWGTVVSRAQALPGDVMVLRSPHHQTFFDKDDGDGFYAVGGNQSNAVSRARFSWSGVRAVVRPPTAATAPVQAGPISADTAPMIQNGDVGDYVSELQRRLGGLLVDGEFGDDTEAAVRAFQASRGIEVDGVVGPETWGELLGRPPAPSGQQTLSPELIAKITSHAWSSPLASYSWKNRGRAPIGFTKGVAVTFARCLLKLKAGDSAVLAMTAPIGGSKDALALYEITETDRPAILRKLFVLLYGLGMRESSGNCFEGRDTSAANTSADTAEAGLFQQSWNSRSASAELPKLLDAYAGSPSPPDGFLPIFREGLSGGPSPNVGSGQGVTFQATCKSQPAFAVEAAAIGLRVLRAHWGPIVRHEAEMRPEADALLRQVEALVVAAPVVVPPEEPIEEPEMSDLDEAFAELDAAVAKVRYLAERQQQVVIPPAAGFDFSELDKVPDDLVTLIWPKVQALSAAQILDIKRKAIAGEIGFMDLIGLLNLSLFDIGALTLAMARAGFSLPGAPSGSNLPAPYQPPSNGGGFWQLLAAILPKGRA